MFVGMFFCFRVILGKLFLLFGFVFFGYTMWLRLIVYKRFDVGYLRLKFKIGRELTFWEWVL